MSTRRSFLTKATAAVAAPYFIPSSAFGGGGKTAPSDRFGVGVIGVGGRGTDHARTCLGRGDTQLLAVCDPQQAKREGMKQTAEKHYANKTNQGAYKGCGAYSDFRELLARDDLDVIFIASPENWHALHLVSAVRAGKDVYSEKAMTLTHGEGLAVIDTVRRYGRIVQIGMQQRSWGIFRQACELVQNGYIGKLHTVHISVPGGNSNLPNAAPKDPPPTIDYNMWLGPAPYTPYNDVKCSFNWYFMSDYCVGWIQSWGIHYLDVAQWGAPSLCTKPLQIEGTAKFPTTGVGNVSYSWKVTMDSADGIHFVYTDDTQGKHGVRFEGDKGWVFVHRGGITAEPASLLKVKLRPDEIHLYEAYDHHTCFFDSVRARKDPSCPVEVGHSGNAIAIACDVATRLGRKVEWDWATQRFTKDDEANRFLTRPFRAPWSL
ncbi:MAG TPA: Gfo/Idh/MocA family oxidoreductase [Planctomycetota bacterium]|jgi:predicted dehydrogenase